MSKKRWFFLWLLFIGYLFLGASIFYTIERDLEEQRRKEKLRVHDQLQHILEEHMSVQKNVKLNPVEREASIDRLFFKLSSYCQRPLLRKNANTTSIDHEPYTWTFYNSFFFALTTLSTIGYGNLSPTSEEGKICVIAYSLIGIPFNGIVLTHLGEFFGSKILRAHHRYKAHFYKNSFSLILDILVYLVPGMGVFILLPSVIFKYLEKWTMIESIYYSFVSLTTIGYGDFVAGQVQGNNAYDVVYKVFLLVWIMFGLGYLVMILGFISRAMRSKQINKLERKVAQTLKHTQSKIWNEFVSDVHYLRRILNEMYLLKVKPVYKEPVVHRVRSQSCPNLSEWPVLRPKGAGAEDSPSAAYRRRRRAFSENGQDDAPRLQRVLSDGALEGIDVQATFSAALLDHHPGIFLPSVFGPGSPEDSDAEDYKESGVDMFSDDEILASEDAFEQPSTIPEPWFLGGRPLRRPGRAMSEAHVLSQPLGQQKTWAGAESLHQFALLKAMRAKSIEGPLDEEKGDGGLGKLGVEGGPKKGLRRLSMAAINFFTPANKLKKKKSMSDIPRDDRRHRLSLQEEDTNNVNQELNYLTQMPDARRPSILDLLASSGRGSESAISPVLEQTSIADFLRVVHSLKAMEAGGQGGRQPTSPLLARSPPPTRHRLNQRRYSQLPGNAMREGVSRPRAASIAPVLAGPVERRLRSLSVTPRASPHQSGRSTPTTRLPAIPAPRLDPRVANPPSLVITSPQGRHRFSIHNVELPQPLRRTETNIEFGKKP